MNNDAFKDIFHLCSNDEGSGDNLTDDDIEQGYVDYIYYEVYNVQQDFPEIDGGMIMLKELFQELFQEKFKSTKDAIPAVLDMTIYLKNLQSGLLSVIFERELQI